MRCRVSVLLSVTLLCAISCGSQEGSADDYPTIEIEGREFANEILSVPPRLYMLDDMLLTFSSDTKQMMNLYRVGTDLELITSYATKGNGRGEFNYPDIGSIIGDTIFVTDQNRLRLTTLLFDRADNRIVDLGQKDYKRVDMNGIGAADGRFFRLENKNYVARSLTGADRIFSLYDAELNLIKHFGHFDFIDGAEALYVRNYIQGTIKSRDRRSRVIYVFDLSGEPRRKITLDRDVDFIFYSKALDRLYAVSEQQDGYIRVYNINYK